jgi:hypothetical protein
MLFRQYWFYSDTKLYDNGIILQLRPFTVIAGSTALDTISECREPGSALLISILNSYSHYTKKALDMFSFTSQTRVTSKKRLVHWTSRFYKINSTTGCEHRPFSDKIIYIYVTSYYVSFVAVQFRSPFFWEEAPRPRWTSARRLETVECYKKCRS